MAMQPRISSGPRLAPLPIPQKPVSPLADALDVAARTAAAIDQSNRQTQQQVDSINHQLAVERQRDEDNALLLQQGAQWAQVQGRLEKRITDARQTHGPGGAGHVDVVRQILQEEVTAFEEGFGENERVRQRYYGNVAEVAAKYETRETLYATDQFAKAQGDNAESYLKTTENSLLLNPDPSRVEEAITLWGSMTDSMAMNDDLRGKANQQGRARIFGSFLSGLIESGQFEQADALLKSGKLNGVIDDIKPYMRKVDVERRAAAVAVEQQQADARDEVREGIKLVNEMRQRGEVPDAKMIESLYQRGGAVGLDPAELYSLRADAFIDSVNKQYNEAVDPTGARASAAVSRLAPKIANGTANGDEQIAYRQLQSIADARGKKAGAALRELVSQGPQGRMAALKQLQALPRGQRIIAGEEAGSGLGYLSLLPEHTQKYAIDGSEVRKARKDEFGKDDQVKAAFKQQLGGAAASLGGDYDDILNVAWDIYAGTLNGKGRAGWDAAHFDTAVRIAFGATKRPNGVLQGGLAKVRGQSVVLPEWKTASEFDQSLARLTFTGAVYADGSAASKGDILTNYRPEYYREDDKGQPIYRFIDGAGKPLRHKDGSLFDIVVAR